ncbi:hypothetical protein [Natrialba hulunbeirensis]|nr:hypothetical protein [Natrialba hulunbeirensis]
MDISLYHIGYAKRYNRAGNVLNRMPREHGDSGTFVETVSLEDVLGVFDVVDGPVILSADVADELDCSRETARRKLQALYERGDLERRKVSRRVVYWEADVTAETMGYDETARDAPQDAGDSIEGTRTSTASSAAESTIDIDAILSDIEVPGFGEKAEARKTAVRAVLEYLVDHKEAESKTLKEIAWEADSETYANARSLWSNAVVKALHQIPEVSSAGERQSGWSIDE